MFGSYGELVRAAASGKVDFHEVRKYLSTLTGIENPGYPDFSKEHERQIRMGADPFKSGSVKQAHDKASGVSHAKKKKPPGGGPACVVVGKGREDGTIKPALAYRMPSMRYARKWLMDRNKSDGMEFVNADTVIDGSTGVVHVAVPLAPSSEAVGRKGPAGRMEKQDRR